MALAQTSYPSAGVGPYTIPFPYLVRAHVEVLVNGAIQTQGVAYTFPTAGSIQFTSSPAPGTIVIRRNSSRNSRLTNYQDGSKLGEAALDFDVNQAFFVAQEALDAAELAIVGGAPPNASTLAVTPVGNLSSSNGQAALQELQGDIDTLNASLTTTNNTVAGIARIPAGVVLDFAGPVSPPGWLECDGSAVSRTTFSGLFIAIGVAFGAGDGSTTFNLPDYRGRVGVGIGAHRQVEVVTGVTAASNAIPIPTNERKWVTGMPVVVTGASGFVGLVNGSYWVVRASATTLQFASSLANAQNGTVITVTGTGSATITYTETARTFAESGGESDHAMSLNELLAHTHGGGAGGTTGALGSGNIVSSATGSRGGNQAMNNLQPFLAVRKIIKT